MCFSRSKGFTLIELLVVMAIISIVTAISIPRILAWMPDMRLRVAAQNLLADLQLAKVEALERNENVVVALTTVACAPPNIPNPNGGYMIFTDDITVNNIFDAGETVIKQVGMPRDSGLCNVALTSAGTATGFLPNGLLIDNNNGVVTLRNINNTTRTVTVKVAGSISVD